MIILDRSRSDYHPALTKENYEHRQVRSLGEADIKIIKKQIDSPIGQLAFAR
ncbi:hypothetical protein [Edwardsiella tarda]|uniref:hypothetical protein n=1 Tax=Edwardsiella tarda TaxID=636 RepID=UPI001561DF28|nr:hypothetical protein [Edwardsiella tarda]